jgi:hypothetical protein
MKKYFRINLKLILKDISFILYNLYLFYMGFSWICLHIYIRFIITRNSYELTDLKDNMTNTYMIFSILFFILHLCSIIISVRIIYNNFYPNNKLFSIFNESILIKSTSYMSNILYWNPLDYMHDLLAPSLPYSGRAFMLIGKFMYKRTNTFFKLCPLILYCLPRIIVASVFFIDIIIYNKIYYFIYVIALIVIPIGFNLFIKFFISFGERNTLIVEQLLIITREDDPNKFTFQVKKELKGRIDLKEYSDYWLLFVRIYNYGHHFKREIAKYAPYITLICSSLYFISWCYILCFIFMNT